MPHTVGYCCINTTLGKTGITTGRTMRQATFQEKGLRAVSTLALQNVQDLIKILEWNARHHITLFRMSSNLFPWNSEYSLADLPDYPRIKSLLSHAGCIADESGQRITAHPDHFVKLGSKDDRVAKNAIHDLHHHSEVFDLMGLSATHFNCLNIHVGQNYSADVIDRFCARFAQLNASTQARLVVENDDKANGFSVKQLFRTIYPRLKTPITFDYFHHAFHPDGWSAQEAAEIAAATWGTVTPLFHYSESKAINESVDCNPRAHADYVFSPINDFGLTVHIDLEAKAKELALFQYQHLAASSSP